MLNRVYNPHGQTAVLQYITVLRSAVPIHPYLLEILFICSPLPKHGVVLTTRSWLGFLTARQHNHFLLPDSGASLPTDFRSITLPSFI